MKKITFLLILIISLAAYSVSRFTDNNDGTVKDNGTGLVWQKCSIGQTYSDGDCTGTEEVVNWQNALSRCNALPAYSGKNWRLPNINELKSILDMSKNSPAIHKVFFPNTRSGPYWSSSTNVGQISNAWTVSFFNSTVYYRNKTYESAVRCVSGP